MRSREGLKRLSHAKRNPASSLALAASLILTLSVAAPVIAEETPTASNQDARVKYVDYDENNVVKIVGHYGYSTHIAFAPGEKVTSVALGDSLAWEVAPVENHLFVKPREDNARTNMTALTDKGRAYTFFLETAAKRPGPKAVGNDLFLRVTFRYPEEAKAKLQPSDEELARKRLADAERQIRNIKYFACGDEDVTPDQAFDDGRFTYLRFAGARDIPAVFIVSSDGSEMLADFHIEVDTVVVHRLAEKFVLRRGGSVGCMVNKGIDTRGIDTLSGTVDQAVVRVIKGAGTDGE